MLFKILINHLRFHLFMAASELEKGKFFEYKGEILQVTRRSLVGCGTHSHTKLVFTVCDISGKKEKEITMGHNDKVDIIDITKKRANVISKSDTGLQIMDGISFETLDATAEPEILATLNEGDEITYIDYKGIRVLGKKKN
jgi:translation elongation factor P/translation initiation factor 5A